MADGLRSELSGLKLSALRRRALAEGVEEAALDRASDDLAPADARAAVVELLLVNLASSRHRHRAANAVSLDQPQAAAGSAPPARAVAATPIGVLLAGDAAARQDAYQQLATLADGGPLHVSFSSDCSEAAAAAAACVAPLVDAVLCADASVVAGAEYRQASLVLARLVLLDPLQAGAALLRNGRGAFAAWAAPGTARAVVMAKDPATLTRDDLLVAACDSLPHLVVLCKGWTEVVAAAGLDEQEWFGAFMADNRFADSSIDERNARLVLLSLEILRDPQGLPGLELAAVWALLWPLLVGRPAVCAQAIDAGLYEVGVAVLRASPAVEWVGWRTVAGLQAGAIFTAIVQTIFNPPPGINLLSAVIESGVADAVVSGLRAFELHGATWQIRPGRGDEANPTCVSHMLCIMQSFDLQAPETEPVVALLRSIPSALRFALENNLDHLKHVGFSSAAFASTICAMVYGKDEGGAFMFSQGMIDMIVAWMQDVLSGSVSSLVALSPSWLTPVVYLCISDVNKALLIQCAGLMPLLLEALWREADSVRKGIDEQIKASIQTDAATCFLQIAVSESGAQLLRHHSAAMDALRALAGGKAFTPEAKTSANGALMAVEGLSGRVREPEPAGGGIYDGSDGHIMVSYQWDYQKTIERVVRSLQKRGYTTWFDMDCMKGSTMDAMSDAVDHAAAMLFAVSLSYKESANCRLEANYAHQQKLEMIPLMMQDSYAPKGWLGLLLGTRLHYQFYDAASLDAQQFEERIDAVVRELGDRGRPKARAASLVSEAPPVAAPAPAPVPAAFAATPPRALVPADATPEQPSFVGSPSIQMMSPCGAAPAGGLAEVSAFVQQLRQDDQAEKAELKAELRLLRQEARAEQALRAELMAGLDAKLARMAPAPAISDGQLAALLARLGALHAAQLLSDDEYFALEDIYGDVIELQSSVGTVTAEMAHLSDAVAKARSICALSEKLTADAALARQLRRRKFV
jgi:hypothetical protein